MTGLYREPDAIEDYADSLCDPTNGWDCDPFAIVAMDYVDDDLDLEADKTDWQVLALDRFGDRNVNGRY